MGRECTGFVSLALTRGREVRSGRLEGPLTVPEKLLQTRFPVGEVAAVIVLNAGELGEGTAGIGKSSVKASTEEEIDELVGDGGLRVRENGQHLLKERIGHAGIG